MLIKFYVFSMFESDFYREEKMARLKEQCPPEGTQHTHISLVLMGGGCRTTNFEMKKTGFNFCSIY